MAVGWEDRKSKRKIQKGRKKKRGRLTKYNYIQNTKQKRIGIQGNNKLVRRFTYCSYGYTLESEIQFPNKRILGVYRSQSRSG